MSLGVIVSSSVLIVGAMAVSPDLLPICATCVGLVAGRRKLALRAFATLTLGMVLVVATAAIVSALTWCPTRGSPGALVSKVVSRSGISGAAIESGFPSGSRPMMLRSNSPATTGRSAARPEASGISRIMSIKRRARSMPTAVRSLSSIAAIAWPTTRAK